VQQAWSDRTTAQAQLATRPPDRGVRQRQWATVGEWTGVEVRALRTAKRMTAKEFAALLGVSSAMVGKWEKGGGDIRPRLFSQQLLDLCLDNATQREHQRFVRLMAPPRRPASRPTVESEHGAVVSARRPGRITAAEALAIVQRTLLREDMQRALSERDIATMFRILSRHGISQRQIAALTGQSQSEISEILGGRRVLSYDVLTRIADGLGIPRGLMGLAGVGGTD
jgi:transcriptional regulator with XRE-family HTH domain